MGTNPNNSASNMLRFTDGAVQFRLRIAVALLSHRTILIQNIRADSITSPGLLNHEVCFLRLIDSITDGTMLQINDTGTQVRMKPGILMGYTQPDTFICASSRNVGWYIEGLLPLIAFGKEEMDIKLQGVTDGFLFEEDEDSGDPISRLDPSVEYWRASSLWSVFEKLGIGVVDPNDFLSNQSPSLRVLSRYAAPTKLDTEFTPTGLVHLYCPAIRSELQAVDLTDVGLVKRIRGTVIVCKTKSTSNAARSAYTAKGVLQRLLPDIWIHTDTDNRSSEHPALSVSLTAETTSGVKYTAETAGHAREAPDDVGQRAACLLLQEVQRGGCVDSTMQALVLLLLCLTPEDVSRVRIGSLTPYTIVALRLYKQAFGVEFKVTAETETKTVLLSCLGTGYRNMARAST